MERLGDAQLTQVERSIYSPGFDDQPTNGYCHTVLMTNDEPQPVAAVFPLTLTLTLIRWRPSAPNPNPAPHQVAALFPKTMAALEARSAPAPPPTLARTLTPNPPFCLRSWSKTAPTCPSHPRRPRI